ncbi:MAG: RNA polymerase sigma factor [Saprospiraceae bacterium]|nr:RNA polymerase sigma factor [Saprospiraceae bacterium]
MGDNKQVEFMEAYAYCHEPFLRYCSALAFGKMDTEDLVQDVLMSAFQHFERIKDKNKLLHYLIRAARNKTVSNWRKRRFQVELLESHTNRLIDSGVDADLVFDIERLYLALARLPEKQRHAIILFEISGFSIKEIADLQDSTEGAIKTKISRGRKRLASLLADTYQVISGMKDTFQVS